MKFYGQASILPFVPGRINELRKDPNLSSRNGVFQGGMASLAPEVIVQNVFHLLLMIDR